MSLQLSLCPLIPVRSPRSERRVFRLGYQLRLPNGPLVEPGDPLLEAFGAEVTWLQDATAYEDQLQSGAFAPPQLLVPMPEGLNDDGDPTIGIWDAAKTARVGTLPLTTALRVDAALDQGLDVNVLALQESRTALDDRRVELQLFVYAPGFVRIRIPRGNPVTKPPARSPRRRLVLVVDDNDCLRWWDPAAQDGPAEIDELPVSADLRKELSRLGRGFEGIRDRFETASGYFERVEAGWERLDLLESGVDLWRKVRHELGRRYAIGYLGPGMERPAWSPHELQNASEGDEHPF